MDGKAYVDKVKIAVRRMVDRPIGQPAPCEMTCTCGEELPAFRGNQVCKCGLEWTGDGWRVMHS